MISPYLTRPLRSLEEARQDIAAKKGDQTVAVYKVETRYSHGAMRTLDTLATYPSACRMVERMTYDAIKAQAGLDTQWGHDAMRKAQAWRDMNGARFVSRTIRVKDISVHLSRED